MFHRVSGTSTGYAPDPRRLEFRGEKQKRAYNRARSATAKNVPRTVALLESSELRKLLMFRFQESRCLQRVSSGAFTRRNDL